MGDTPVPTTITDVSVISDGSGDIGILAEDRTGPVAAFTVNRRQAFWLLSQLRNALNSGLLPDEGMTD